MEKRNRSHHQVITHVLDVNVGIVEFTLMLTNIFCLQLINGFTTRSKDFSGVNGTPVAGRLEGDLYGGTGCS